MSKKSSNNHLVLIAFIIFLVGMYALLFKQTTRHTDMKLSLPLIEQSNTYTSEALDISFVVPGGFKIEEIQPVVYLRSDKGEISITKNNLNVDDFELFIEQYDERRNITVLSSTKLQTDNYKAYERVMKFNGMDRTQKSYFIYPSQWRIYTLSTTSPELYDNLEAIIQSFEYLGE